MKAVILGVFLSMILLGCAPSITEQARRLGTKPFTSETWLAASKLERSEMVWSFLSQHDIKTLTRSRVIELLGRPNCYSGYDEDPSYCVGPDTIENGWGTGYQVVFISDRKGSGRIAEVEISPVPE